MARMTSIASAKILLRSSSSIPIASESDVSAPGLTPMTKRPCERWSNIAALTAMTTACIGQMLAHESIVEAELVSEDDRLTILAQRLGPVPVHRVNGHGEVTQPHQAFSISPAIAHAS